MNELKQAALNNEILTRIGMIDIKIFLIDIEIQCIANQTKHYINQMLQNNINNKILYNLIKFDNDTFLST